MFSSSSVSQYATIRMAINPKVSLNSPCEKTEKLVYPVIAAAIISAAAIKRYM